MHVPGKLNGTCGIHAALVRFGLRIPAGLRGRLRGARDSRDRRRGGPIGGMLAAMLLSGGPAYAMQQGGPTQANHDGESVRAAPGGERVESAGQRRPLLVFAASSLTDVLGELGDAYTKVTHVPVQSSFEASSVLARQIEAGAPADVFFCADRDWMDYLEQRHLLRQGSRQDVVGNRLVLIAAAASRVHVKLAPGVDLGPALGPGGRLATGDPDSVPAGKYAEAALKKLGIWDRVSGRIVGAENVRAALAYVARGEAPLGIVYRTDALVEKRVRVVDVFPLDSYPKITYPIALTLHAGARAGRFVEFVRSSAAAQIFRKYGFEPIDGYAFEPRGKYALASASD